MTFDRPKPPLPHLPQSGRSGFGDASENMREPVPCSPERTRNRFSGPDREEDVVRDQYGRFQKGSTGNRLGRRPRIKYSKTDPMIFFNTQVEMKRNGRSEQVTRHEAFMEMLYAQAMTGKVSAMRMIERRLDAWQQRDAEVRDMFRFMTDKYMKPGGPPAPAWAQRWIETTMEALTLGQDSISRFRNMDHARSARRRRLKERKEAEAAAAAEAEAREARRAARKAKAEAKKKPKPDVGSEGGAP